MPVGLVVVSHSRPLARAAVALAGEMLAGEPVAIEIAAGLDETTLGTDATAIEAAITAADRGDGVVVLMDLGSAVLSAELALELLTDDSLRDRVLLCPAPLVEGLVAAAVAAAGGAGRHEVAKEATRALEGKHAQLGAAETAAEAAMGTAKETAVETAGRRAPAASGSATVTNAHGVHARPAARLVTRARTFDAAVELRNRTTGSGWVPATSLSRVATLGVLPGHHLDVRATGRQAAEAVDAILDLAARAFDEPPTAMADKEVKTDKTYPASPGTAIGPARQLRAAAPEIPNDPSRGADEEWRRLESALAGVRAELETRHHDIFDAHRLLLDDPDLLTAVRDGLHAGRSAPHAWHDATTALAREFGALADPYQKERAADVRAISDQVLRALLGARGDAATPSGILITADLTPADAVTLDPVRVPAVLLAYGSPTSHAAILLRARGIPAVTGLGPSVLTVPDGTEIAVDGGTGETVIAPGPDVLADFRRRRADQAARQATAITRSANPAVTRDGVTISVGATLGSVADARAAAESGADMAGLVRTEFLFLDRDEAPGADEQQAVYREIAEACGGRRITLRTLDAGGDKPLRFLPSAAEANPFLGVRGIRHSLEHPALLADQLLAIVRVAQETPVSVMFPMVATVTELARTRELLDQAIARAGRGRPAGLHVGIMVEVPAAALKAAAFDVDFLSIGTNDLTQYALAAERGNPALAGLSDGFDPGVLRLVDAACRGARGRATVAVCGELAADERAIPLLTALGVRELSMAPHRIPAAKEAVRHSACDHPAARRALDLPDAAAVREAARQLVR